MPPSLVLPKALFEQCAEVVGALYDSCYHAHPNYGINRERFETAVATTVSKYLYTDPNAPPSVAEIHQLLGELQASDLFLALACAAGSEAAWWDFDQGHRAYLERVARHLASAETNAEDVVDAVYVELYGTKIVDGVRQSKFASYAGRGSLRGWLRTIVWHSLVDLHRASHDEVSLDELTENVGEGHAHASFLNSTVQTNGENQMLDAVLGERYRAATMAALETSFAALDDHEKLLLFYYHVENLKLREIARLVEVPASPLRQWFQRKTTQREKSPDSRVHESTVMRWLEKVYAKIFDDFRQVLTGQFNLKQAEIAACMEVALTDIARGDINHLISPN